MLLFGAFPSLRLRMPWCFPRPRVFVLSVQTHGLLLRVLTCTGYPQNGTKMGINLFSNFKTMIPYLWGDDTSACQDVFKPFVMKTICQMLACSIASALRIKQQRCKHSDEVVPLRSLVWTEGFLGFDSYLFEHWGRDVAERTGNNSFRACFFTFLKIFYDISLISFWNLGLQGKSGEKASFKKYFQTSGEKNPRKIQIFFPKTQETT